MRNKLKANLPKSNAPSDPTAGEGFPWVCEWKAAAGDHGSFKLIAEHYIEARHKARCHLRDVIAPPSDCEYEVREFDGRSLIQKIFGRKPDPVKAKLERGG